MSSGDGGGGGGGWRLARQCPRAARARARTRASEARDDDEIGRTSERARRCAPSERDGGDGGGGDDARPQERAYVWRLQTAAAATAGDSDNEAKARLRAATRRRAATSGRVMSARKQVGERRPLPRSFVRRRRRRRRRCRRCLFARLSKHSRTNRFERAQFFYAFLHQTPRFTWRAKQSRPASVDCTTISAARSRSTDRRLAFAEVALIRRERRRR